jgi:hypothetical protein
MHGFLSCGHRFCVNHAVAWSPERRKSRLLFQFQSFSNSLAELLNSRFGKRLLREADQRHGSAPFRLLKQELRQVLAKKRRQRFCVNFKVQGERGLTRRRAVPPASREKKNVAGVHGNFLRSCSNRTAIGPALSGTDDFCWFSDPPRFRADELDRQNLVAIAMFSNPSIRRRIDQRPHQLVFSKMQLVGDGISEISYRFDPTPPYIHHHHFISALVMKIEQTLNARIAKRLGQQVIKPIRTRCSRAHLKREKGFNELAWTELRK